MPELPNVQHLLDEARRAADAGDLAAASALLQDAARIQEAELGPLHPELANTLNNLGIVAESQGHIGEAETYYRRAVAITSASLPPDDPMVASSRKNLEDFCRERGLPVEPPVSAPPVERPRQTSVSVVQEHATSEAKSLPPAPLMAPTELAPQPSRPASSARAVADSIGDADHRLPAPADAATTKPPLAIVAIGVLVVVAATLLVMRPSSRGESPVADRGPATAPQAEPASPTTPAPSPAPAPAATEKPQSPAVASRDDKSSAAAAKAAAPKASSGDIALVTSQLCRTFSASGNWRCDPAGQSVSPGAIVLYTRVKSPRNAIVIHRWYRGDTLRKSARLTILANSTDGYRTYSRQTVKSGENWRVEVTDTAGDVLYEQRLSVR
jgi:hypothetical protein